ncbi:MAG: ATP-dependent helicase HelY [Acidobacteriota bacterium]|jgi:superfamily II RNA helicase|nr:ATP-dependent helicase HelY [Acidobacteriota bacterium]
MPDMPPAQLLGALKSYDLLPAIVFLPTRRRCDEAASEAALSRRLDAPERRDARRAIMNDFVLEHPEVRKHRHWETIIKGGVAAHHAGHIPAWKLVIERLMSNGLLDAIFATATVAAGVDFPARTVVISNVDARTSGGWRTLSASELQQMTGRAGRRGRDKVGFIVAAPGLHQDPERIAHLLISPPEPLQSHFRATYSTLLNLLDAYESFAQVREIVERSFAHRDAARRIVRLEREHIEAEARVRAKLDQAGCDLPTSAARALERLASARTRLLETLPQTRAEVLFRWLDEVVVPGRVVAIGRNSRRLVFVMRRRNGNLIGMREDGRGANLPLGRVGRVFAPVYPLTEESIEAAFAEVRSNGRELALEEPRLSQARTHEDDAVNIINDMIDEIVPRDLSEDQRRVCSEALWSVIDDVETAERCERSIESIRSQVWDPFERRARVLAAFGYLDFPAERVTDRGRWLADLHVDRPLLVGEAVEKGLFASLDTTRTTGLVAAMTADEERDYGELELDDALVTTLARFEEVAYKVSTEEWKQGLEPAPQINFSAAATAARWADGCEWIDLVRETRAEEGDLVRMLSRTGEALLQIAGLKRAQPAAADVAARASSVVLREPVR